jgi:molybdopterin-guanine dinucleotide biosynthesis protein A
MEPPINAAAIILAGGKSTRLGRDKASEMLLGKPLLQRAIERVEGLVAQCVVVRAAGQVLPDVPAHGSLRVVEDVYSDSGPLGGLYTGLAAVDSALGLVVACDMPLLQPSLLGVLLRQAAGHEAVVPVTAAGPEPLCAVYSRECLPAVKQRLDDADYKVMNTLQDLNVLYLDEEEWRRFDPEGLSFLNVNTQADLERVAGLILAGK